MTSPISDYARLAISQCLKVKKGENVLIFTDRHKVHFAEDLAGAINDCGAYVSIFYVPEAIRPVERITDLHAVSLAAADAVIYVLETESNGIDLSREVAFRHYLIAIPRQYKGRICMMPGFTEEMKDAVAIDYAELDQRCRWFEGILKDKSVKITTELGTDVQFSLKGRKFILNNGDISRPGLYGNIPAGEIYTAPVEETMNGRLVIDGSVGSLGMTDSPFAIDVKAGQIVGMQPLGDGKKVCDKFNELSQFDLPATKTVGEFGVGLNPGAKIVGNMLMDEKVLGTIHFAFGDSYGLGQSSSGFHVDLMITKPSIFVEGKCVMDLGEFISYG
jgi:leucyl aminopeptidase (aminopeptidase T)